MEGSWLITLMCPLMMLPMIFLMLKSKKPASSEQQTKMKEELEILKDQNSSMREILEQVKQKRELSK